LTQLTSHKVLWYIYSFLLSFEPTCLNMGEYTASHVPFF
jgi:hypothetical protein